MTPDTTIGRCSCGAEVHRELAAGPAAKALNAIPFVCPGCEQEAADQWRQEDAADEARYQQQRALERIHRHLPAELRGVRLDELDSRGCEPAIAAAHRWAAAGGGLLLTGPFGTGKTTIAAGALRERILTGRPGRWTTAPLLMARLGSGFGTPQRAAAMKLLSGSNSALVIDDLDKTRPTEYGAEQIFLAVDGAVTNRRALLVTTNLSLSELAARWQAPFGEAIASRLVAYCTAAVVTGADRRLQARPAAAPKPQPQARLGDAA